MFCKYHCSKSYYHIISSKILQYDYLLFLVGKLRYKEVKDPKQTLKITRFLVPTYALMYSHQYNYF